LQPELQTGKRLSGQACQHQGFAEATRLPFGKPMWLGLVLLEWSLNDLAAS